MDYVGDSMMSPGAAILMLIGMAFAVLIACHGVHEYFSNARKKRIRK